MISGAMVGSALFDGADGGSSATKSYAVTLDDAIETVSDDELPSDPEDGEIYEDIFRSSVESRFSLKLHSKLSDFSNRDFSSRMFIAISPPKAPLDNLTCYSAIMNQKATSVLALTFVQLVSDKGSLNCKSPDDVDSSQRKRNTKLLFT